MWNNKIIFLKNFMDTLLLEGGTSIGCNINKSAFSQLKIFLNELQVWNNKINLTGLKHQRDMTVTLFIDSLAFSKHLCSGPQDISVLDIGTGAGFPGLALKIVHPSMNLTLLEPNRKKVAFLHHVIGLLGLSGVKVVSSTIEEADRNGVHGKLFDRVLIKALKFSRCLPYLHHLIQPTATITLWRSCAIDTNEDLFGFHLSHEIPYTLPFGYGSRVFSILTP